MKIFNNCLYMIKILYTKSKGMMVLEIIMQVVRGLIPLISAYLSKIILDSLSGSNKYQNNFGALLLIILALLVIQFTYEYLQISSTRTTIVASHKISKYIQNELVNKMSCLDKRYFDSSKTLDLIRKGQSFDANMVLDTYRKFTGIFRNITTIVSSLIILLNFNWLIACISIIIYFPMLRFELKKVKSFNKLDLEITEDVRKKDYYAELLTSSVYAKELRLDQYGDYFIKKYELLRKKIFKKTFKQKIQNNKSDAIINVLKIITNIGVFSWLIYLAIKKEISIGDVTFLHTAFLSVDSVLKWNALDIASFAQNSQTVDYFKELIGLDNNIIKDNEGLCVDLNHGRHDVEFKNVTFTYPEARVPVIKNLSFKMQADQTIGIVGLNGSGKTTIAKLLLRMYDCDEGEILIDGRNVRKYNAIHYYNQWSILMQEYNLYPISLKNNIALGVENKDIDFQKMQRAVNICSISEMINKLPNKYDTIIGKQFYHDGIVLSDGQAQKIAFARSFYKESEFILLDEPSASLDASSEFLIFSQINDLLNKKNGIIITHRLSNVMTVDKIIVIKNGELIEEGTHEDLLDKNGEYSRLYEMQSERFRSDICYET